jgi:F-type H+-transporting ATPase subunit epsilon
MADRLLLRIVTPRALLLEAEVLEVVAPGSAGEFGVLPEHISFLTSLEPGVLRYRTRTAEEAVAILGGFAEVRNNTVTILADDAVRGSEVQPDEVRAELNSLQQRLESLTPTDEPYPATDRLRRWAEARLQAAKGSNESRYH